MTVRKMAVPLHHGQGLPAAELHDSHEIHAGHDEAGSEGVPEIVEAEARRGFTTRSASTSCCMRVTPVGLTVESLYDERFAIFASPRHPLAGRRRVNPHELSGLPLVASTTAALNDVMETKLRAVSVTPRVVAEGKHHDAIKQLVEADVGYSILVEPSVRDELASGRLVELDLAAPPIYGTIAVAYLAQPIVPPLVRSFIQFVRAALTAGRERRATPTASQKRRK